jgi:DNA invertase Pin-like site-specific DNA recombinase
VIKILITGIYPFEDHGYNPHTISISGLAYISVPLLLTGQHLIETVEDLKNRGIGFKSIQEAIDTGTSAGKLYFHVFCALAEFERDLIKERTFAGLEAARTRGRKGGRRRVISEHKIQAGVELAHYKNRTVGEICSTLGINTGSYYRYIYPRLKEQQKQTI